MRLIDADKLTPENTHIIERIETVDGYKIKTYEIICDAPTVQPCEDAVSRAEAISRIEVRRKITCESDPYYYEEWTKGYEEGIDDAIAMISSVPSVTPQKKGKWLHPYKSDIACECSVCHRQMPITNDYYFCPICGADMRGDENE